MDMFYKSTDNMLCMCVLTVFYQSYMNLNSSWVTELSHFVQQLTNYVPMYSLAFIQFNPTYWMTNFIFVHQQI